MTQQGDDPLIGTVLSDRFEVISPLGAGGMGRVYKAIQRPLDRVVALKVLSPRHDGSKDPGFEKRFFLEASMTAKLKHPNTITVHDYGRTDDGIYFLAMEYIEGQTLQQQLNAEGTLHWSRALFIGAQIARSLREAHKLGLVHRDLKPANVMLVDEATVRDVVKVLDFGLVKSFQDDASEAKEGDITQKGVMLGSPLYMAPEQAKGRADPRTDIYALGVVLFQCITGRPPFLGKEAIDIIVKHLREPPPDLQALVPEVPPAVHALVMKCLEKSPEARFQNMDEVLEAMRLVTQAHGMSGAFTDPRTPAIRAPKSSEAVHKSHTPIATRLARNQPLTGDSAPVDFPTGVHRRRSRVLLGVALASVVVIGVAGGGLLALNARAPHIESPTQAPLQPTPEPPRKPQKTNEIVTFDITSDPEGAVVTREGVEVGTTPCSLELDRTTETAVQVELQFELEGYSATSVVAQGQSGSVPVHAVLTKKAESKTPKKKGAPKPSGYKDDPYQ